MAETHFSGPLVVGGHQLTGNPPIQDITDPDADATYSANEQALLNACKAKINQILAALRAAGIIEP